MKMMKKTYRQKAAALTSCIFAISLATFAQDKPTADAGAELVSSYIWRGQDLGNISLQPTLSIGWRGFALTAWGSAGLDKDDTKEFDLTLGYAAGGFHLALTDYWFDNGPGYFHYGSRNTAHVFEANLGYDFGFLSVNWFTNFAGNDGVNREGNRAYSSYLSLAAPFRLGGLDWTAEMGAVPWATGFYNATADDPAGAGGFEVANVGIGASKDIRITEHYSLPLFAKLTWNPATEGAYFVFGLRLF